MRHCCMHVWNTVPCEYRRGIHEVSGRNIVFFKGWHLFYSVHIRTLSLKKESEKTYIKHCHIQSDEKRLIQFYYTIVPKNILPRIYDQFSFFCNLDIYFQAALF
jgi:hypothetical protein